ncbi:YciI family protein [soil metagenome]
MPKYMILLHDSPDAFATISPDQMQRVIEKYMAWGERLRASGAMLAGEKLADEPGKVMRGKAGAVRVTDGPYSETKEVLGGYYIVQAENYDKAVEIARDCPQFEFGGSIEVREIEDMGQG